MIGPVTIYFDRFLIGNVVSISAVAFYTAPHEAITKLAIISAAITSVLYPAFAARMSRGLQENNGLATRGIKYIFGALLPVVLIVVTFAPELLDLWLGREFSENGAFVAQILAIGVLINGIALVPFVFIQAVGRPDLTAKLHLAETPLYLGALWALVHAMGIDGVALAWSLRVVVDTVILFLIAYRVLGWRTDRVGRLAVIIGVTGCCLAGGMWLDDLTGRMIFSFFLLIALGWAFWAQLLSSDDRALALRWFRHARATSIRFRGA